MMRSGFMRSLATMLLVLLAGCSLTPLDETKDWGPDRIYYAARSELESKNYQKAISYYQKLESRYPYGRFAQQAQLDTAFAYWKDAEPALALAACDRFIREHPNHPNVDYAYYLKGRINFNEDLGMLGFISGKDLSERDPQAARDAFDAFKDLVTRFPDSKYAKDSEARMKYLVNALSSHEAHVAEYYYRRAAYVAAVNRAQYVLKTYPRTPAVERALVVMTRSYDAMGLPELRDDTERMLRTNFPDNKLAVRHEPRAWWMFW
jgi:outer membrane protein assembly factor BamD